MRQPKAFPLIHRKVLRGIRSLSSFQKRVEQLALDAGSERFDYRQSHRNHHVRRPRRTVTLLHPPGACSAFTRSGSQYPPLGLLQLKAVVGDSARVEVLEGDGNGWSDDETARRISDEDPLAVGMTVTCGTKGLVHAWSSIVKHMFWPGKEAPIVLVGGPATAFESESIFGDCPQVDVIVKGEGEVAFPSMVDVLEETSGLPRDATLQALSKIPSVNVRARPQVNDGTIANLDKAAFETLPFPDLSTSPVHAYRAPDAKRSPMITMMTQRGCIAKCAFCNTPQIHGNMMRGWSNEQIVQELKSLKAMHGIREVSFVDDVFTNRRGGPRKLCEMMIDANLDLTWYCNARADQVTEKMAATMKSAGCHQVFLGFESGCDKMLRRIQKGETVADLEQGSALLKEAGINISVGFIVGLPGETQESVAKSIELCNRVKPYRAQFTRFTPIPGSQLANQHTGHTLSELPRAGGFHDRSREDQIERWLKQCYEQCSFKPSL